MVHLKVKRGLDIPIVGKASGEIQTIKKPKKIALNLSPFPGAKFKLLVKPNEVVCIGQPLVQDKDLPDRVFTAPGAGVIKEVLRGHQRRLLNITIDLLGREDYVECKKIHPNDTSREELIHYLLAAGLFPRIRQRPFNHLADPRKLPKSIFVKAIESAPFAPPAELQVQHYEEEFQAGLTALSHLTEGHVHLVHHINSICSAFINAENVEIHTAEGPHPVGNHSVHIHHIDPIRHPEDIVWTLNTLDVICIGHHLLHGVPYLERIISIAGGGILPGKRGYFRVREGTPIADLLAERVPNGNYRYISGDVLTGTKVEAEDYLGYYDTAFVVIPENTEREFLHFMGLGFSRYSATGAYASGHLGQRRKWAFTTSLHGEPRPFVTNETYETVMPMRIPIMLLVRAVMAGDYDQAKQLGLLEVDSEDLALPTFVCPSKIEMTSLIRQGLEEYAKQVTR